MTPLVMLGHEAAGVVEAVGPGVTRLVVGDHVVLTPCPPCGRCYWCVRGEHSIRTRTAWRWPRRCTPTVAPASGRGGETVLPRARRGRARRDGGDHPGDGRGQDPRRRAARRGLRDRLRGADGGRRGAAHRRRAVRRHRPGARAWVVWASRSCKALRLAGATTIIVSDPVAEPARGGSRLRRHARARPHHRRCGRHGAWRSPAHRRRLRLRCRRPHSLARAGPAWPPPAWAGTTVMVGVPGITEQLVIESPTLLRLRREEAALRPPARWGELPS